MQDRAERRRALRVPVRGGVVFYAEDGAMHGTIENLSRGGALVTVAGAVPEEPIDLELKLGLDSGWITARAVRVERTARRWKIAVAFDQIGDEIRAAIDAAILAALRATHRRPVLIIDDDVERRGDLLDLLSARGMTPVAARTPLDAIELLTRTQLHISVCLLAPSFGHSFAELRALVSDSFPWVSTAEISNDLEQTADRAAHAWSGTEVARIARAVS